MNNKNQDNVIKEGIITKIIKGVRREDRMIKEGRTTTKENERRKKSSTILSFILILHEI